jgi:hypothetical protein
VPDIDEEKDREAMDLRIVDPSGSEPPAPARGTGPRLASLAGARIVALDNGKPNAAYVVRQLAERLAERFGAQEPVAAEKANSSVPMTAEELDRFRNFDAAIVGVGD